LIFSIKVPNLLYSAHHVGHEVLSAVSSHAGHPVPEAAGECVPGEHENLWEWGFREHENTWECKVRNTL